MSCYDVSEVNAVQMLGYVHLDSEDKLWHAWSKDDPLPERAGFTTPRNAVLRMLAVRGGGVVERLDERKRMFWVKLNKGGGS